MRLWKVTWTDGRTNVVQAETAWSVRHEIYRDQRTRIAAVTPVGKGVCGEPANPYAPAGLPGHRQGRLATPTGPLQAALGVKTAPTPRRRRFRV